jgi:hypothetical protein
MAKILLLAGLNYIFIIFLSPKKILLLCPLSSFLFSTSTMIIYFYGTPQLTNKYLASKDSTILSISKAHISLSSKDCYFLCIKLKLKLGLRP